MADINFLAEEVAEKVFEKIRNCGNLIIVPQTNTNTPITEKPFDLETQRHKEIVQKLCNQIGDKRLNIAVIADWVGKSENYCQRRIQKRNTFTKTVWAVDVLKFVCEEWQMPLPECYEQQIEKFNRQNERKRNRIKAA